MQLIADKEKYSDKEALYLQVRNGEGRIITNEELKLLPYLPASSAHYQEWALRAKNYERLKKYLSKKGKALRILEVGCGNGWLSHRLYEEGHIVVGLDLNLAELQQAEMTFGTTERLQWVYADILLDSLPFPPFDIILFAASIQYFQDIHQVKHVMLPILKATGELHVYDSIFYTADAVAAAKSRTLTYYAQLGFPAMATYYHHHTIDTLSSVGFKKMKSGLFAPKQILQWWWLQK